jgi:putative phosphoesterase
MSDDGAHVIGLISDTHGLVRADVHTALAGVELILHAGDVGGDEVLDELALIAPVLAVYGNTDTPGDPRLAASIERTIGGLRIHVSHGHELGSPTPKKLLENYAADVIVYGHTHQQYVSHADGRLVVNPGAAGPRRFKLEPSVARLTITGGRSDVTLVPLGD